ncbi:MAG: hypothetical protein KGJ62_03660 [Armatimonadetes bacterium]|nr:hypothetical protein [Armatimonadota bacterium]MDE2205949.1 hypothetical protein [Armatimonadota bacterium]
MLRCTSLSRRAYASSILRPFEPQGNPAEKVNSSDIGLASFAFDARSISGTATDPYFGFGSEYGRHSEMELGV